MDEWFILIYLVGGFNPSEKYESQLGWLFPYIMENEKMFQTTNQLYWFIGENYNISLTWIVGPFGDDSPY